MIVKSLNLRGFQVKNNVFMAPMAGYTDGAFRKLITSLGAGLSFTELVSAKGIIFGAKDNAVLLSSDDYDKNAVQIFGEDAYSMRKACESKDLEPFRIVDINMGCPVPKVYKNGEGSALLKDVLKAEQIVKECAKSGKIITVKIRTGLTKGNIVATEFSKMAESSGASMITIHGRVREDYYSGEPDYKAIEEAKKSVNIPVIANGGIFTEKDADTMIDKTGADGIMIARGGLKDPFLFSRLTKTETQLTLKDFMILHLKGMSNLYSARRTALEFRKFVPYYLNGMKNSKELKMKLFSAESEAEIEKLINTNL